MPQLHPEFYISELFWLGLCFIILYLVALRIIAPRMQAIFKQRETQLQTIMTAAEAEQAEAQKLQMEYDRIIELARRKAHDFVGQATHDLAAEVTERKHKTQERLQDSYKQAERRFEQQKQASIRAIETYAQDLSAAIVAKLLSSNLPAKAPKAAKSRSRT